MSTPRLFRAALRVGVADLHVFWSSWRMWLFTSGVRVVTQACMWVLLGKMIGSAEALHFLLIGQAVLAGTQATGFTVAASAWDRMEGTYPLLVISPASLVPLMMGRSIVWMGNGVLSSLLTFAVLLPLFGLMVPLSRLLLLPLFVVVICASSFGFFLLLGSFVVRAPQLRSLVFNVASILIAAFCGVVVPMTFWPRWLNGIALGLPVTHGLAALRSFLEGGPGGAVARGLLLEGAVGLSWLLLAALLMDRMADVGRRDGSIELA